MAICRDCCDNSGWRSGHLTTQISGRKLAQSALDMVKFQSADVSLHYDDRLVSFVVPSEESWGAM